MPMYDKKKMPLDFPFHFHDALKRIHEAWLGYGKQWPGGVVRDFALTAVMNQDDYTPRPVTLAAVKERNLRTEVNRWNAFKYCLRRHPDFWLTATVNELKLSPKVKWGKELTRFGDWKEGFYLTIEVKRRENHLANILAIES